MVWSTLLFVWLATCGFAHGAAVSFTIPSHRDVADRETVNGFSGLRKRQSGNVSSAIGKSLYWFGHWSVGDSSSLRLLIDTGSSDLILNTGIYRPSKNEKPYAGKNFTITYEGVNRDGFGFETINGSLSRDIVSAGGLTVKDQPLGNVTSFKYFDVPQLPYANQGQGIIGFLGPGSSSFKPPAPSWFISLCNNKAISYCRFGLAFGTSGKGQTIVGKLAKSLFTGDLVTVKRYVGKPWFAYTVQGDVTIDNKIVAANQTIIMDVGTDNIQGPIDVTRDILENILGYQTQLLTQSDNLFNPGTPSKTLLGYFACDKPPTLGFSFPAQAELKKGQKAKIFNVSPAVWDVYNNGHNNCTSILGGTNALTDKKENLTAWLLGQSFFAGHYIDFDVTGQTIGFADLKDPSTAASR